MAIEIKPKVTSLNTIDFASMLLFARNQIHILHLQSLSYAQHVALNEAYDLILDSFDQFVETIQGKEGIILKGYKSYSYVDTEPIAYIQTVINAINTYRKSLSTNYDEIDNMLQETVSGLEKIVYKLKFLK